MSGRWWVCLLLPVCAGCLVPAGLPVIRRVETTTETPYYLYVPSDYTDREAWALVVSCHGTPFWDVAERQAAEWSGLAERKGFLVAAPELVGTRGDFLPPTGEQIRRQEVDERRILAVIKSIRGAYNVPEDRVFLTGWSAGSFAVLHTGLRHPEVFRALAIRQGNFQAPFFEPLLEVADPYQPILVSWGYIDLLKSQSRSCYQWLKRHGLAAEMHEISGGHRRHPEVAFDFFLHCLKKVPWVLLRAEADPQDPMAVLFGVKGSPPVVRCDWDFGDGESSTAASPRHVYVEAGKYAAGVRLQHRGGQVSQRSTQVVVPKHWAGAAH